MRRRVYRSLDKPSEFFGIKGRFMMVMFFLSVCGITLSIMVGQIMGMIFGIGAAILLCAISYFITIVMQSKTKEKDFFKIVTKKLYPQVYAMRPKHIRNIWKGFNLNNKLIG